MKHRGCQPVSSAVYLKTRGATGPGLRAFRNRRYWAASRSSLIFYQASNATSGSPARGD